MKGARSNNNNEDGDDLLFPSWLTSSIHFQ
jgi:hypothetical protein